MCYIGDPSKSKGSLTHFLCSWKQQLVTQALCGAPSIWQKHLSAALIGQTVCWSPEWSRHPAGAAWSQGSPWCGYRPPRSTRSLREDVTQRCSWPRSHLERWSCSSPGVWAILWEMKRKAYNYNHSTLTHINKSTHTHTQMDTHCTWVCMEHMSSLKSTMQVVLIHFHIKYIIQKTLVVIVLW